MKRRHFSNLVIKIFDALCVCFFVSVGKRMKDEKNIYIHLLRIVGISRLKIKIVYEYRF